MRGNAEPTPLDKQAQCCFWSGKWSDPGVGVGNGLLLQVVGGVVERGADAGAGELAVDDVVGRFFQP